MTAAASCRGMQELFFDPAQGAHAVQVCKGCPVRLSCLRDAIDEMFTADDGRPIAWTVRGGLLPWRRALGSGEAAVSLHIERA